METNSFLFVLIIFFAGIIFAVSAYYEYTLQQCKYQQNQLKKKQKSIFESEPILLQDTNLENQYDDSPYSLYKDYFDQASPWVGTEWSHPSAEASTRY